VFAFVADGENASRWRTGVLDIQRVSGQGVGAVYRQGVRGPGGRRIAADYEVTAYQPDALMAFKTIAGPVRPTGEFRLQESDGTTTLTMSLRADLAGVKRLFMSSMVQKTMDAEVAAIGNVKRLLEP
jgi:carbon monoxide dehydrogenase subunit G